MKTVKKILKYLSISILLILVIFIIWLFIPGKNYDLIKNPRKSTEYWELKTGSKIAYTHIKSKTDSIKATLIYLHGGPGGYTSNSEINVFEEVSKEGYEIYLYDQIGCGFSERLKDLNEYSVTRHTADLNEIIDKVKTKKTILIGQSWGGYLGAYYSANYPKKIDKLVLTSPGGIYPTDSIALSKYPEDAIPGLINIDKRIEKINLEMEKGLSVKEKLWLIIGSITANNSIISDDKVDGIFNNMSKIFIKGVFCDSNIESKNEPDGRPGMYCSIFTTKSRKTTPNDLKSKIKNYKNPVLILKGQCDYISWRETYEYKSLFPNSELKVIKNAGHSILRGNTKDYITEIVNFIETK